MPRDPSGNYTLPALGNPAVTNTPITIAWWNGTGTDLASAMTDSLSRTGSGGMLGPFGAVDGTAGAPGLTFQSESTSGFFRPSAGEIDVVISGAKQSRWTSGGFQGTVDGGATWKFPIYQNLAGQSITSGTVDFTVGTLLVGGVAVRAGAAPTITKSSSCGSFSTTSTSFTAVTNLSVTFTATGSAVLVQLVSDDSSNPAYLQAGNSNTSNLQATMDVALSTDNGSTFFARQQIGAYATGLSGTTLAAFSNVVPVTSYVCQFSPSAGSTTVKVYVKSGATAGTTTSAVTNAKLCITQF